MQKIRFCSAQFIAEAPRGLGRAAALVYGRRVAVARIEAAPRGFKPRAAAPGLKLWNLGFLRPGIGF